MIRILTARINSIPLAPDQTGLSLRAGIVANADSRPSRPAEN
jgi:hypothetical protein